MTRPSRNAHDQGGLAGIGLGLLLIAFTLCGCDERRQYSYATLADAVAAGEVTRGWLPDWLPTGAHTINLLYSADSPQTWGAFQFAPADMGLLRRHLMPLVAESDLQHLRGAGTSWWPEFLSEKVDPAALRQRGLALYVEADPGPYPMLFAINEGKGVGFFCRRPAEGAR